MESAAAATSTLTRSVSLTSRLRRSGTARFPSTNLSSAAAAAAASSPRGLSLRRARSDADLAGRSAAAVVLRHSPIPAILEADDEDRQEILDGAGAGRNGNNSSGGRGGNGGGGSGSGCDMGEYYRRVLRTDPSNPLLLRNYGRYLQEVERDLAGAEACYARALLACPGDADLLSLYGTAIWEARQDKDRAAAYLERAVEAAPDDCYVLGSYASFLWDAVEDEAAAADAQKEEASAAVVAAAAACAAPALVPAC